MIWLIKKLWTDSMENHTSNAMGYKVIGYVNSEVEAREIIANGGEVIGDGWPLCRGEIYRILISEPVEAMNHDY